MTSEIELFKFPENGQEIRMTMFDGEPWFVAADICSALELKNVSQATSNLDDDERRTVDVSAGQHTLIFNEGIKNPKLIFVNEPGLYSLVLRSNKAEAKLFKRWITHDVLPSIRKTGSYEDRLLAKQKIQDLAFNPRGMAEALIQAGQIALDAVEAREAADRRVRELEPAAEAWEELAEVQQGVLLRDVAALLKKTGIKIGQNELFSLLESWNIIYRDARRRWKLYAEFNPVHFSYSGKAVILNSGESFTALTIRVRPEGIRYIRDRVKKMNDLPPGSSLEIESS